MNKIYNILYYLVISILLIVEAPLVLCFAICGLICEFFKFIYKKIIVLNSNIKKIHTRH